MVWIMSGPTGPDLAFGPIDPREEAEIRAYLASPDAQGRRPALLASEAEIDPDATGPTIRAAAGHVFVRDFVREQVDKAREEANRRTSAAVRANPPDPPHHPEEAEMEKDEDRDVRPPATSSSSSAPHPPHPECNGEAKKKKKKTLTWEEGDRLEEAPLRMLRGASGMIFHADNDFVFIVFYDDESDDDVFAAAEKVEVQHAQPASSSLRFEAVTFDAEKLLEPVYLGESSCTFAAYNIRLKGNRVTARDMMTL